MMFLIWLVAAILFLIAELFLPGFIMMSVAGGCLAAGISSLFSGSFVVHLLAGSCGILASALLVRPLFLGRRSRKDGDGERSTPVGRRGTVSRKTGPGETGQVLIDGVYWLAVSDEPLGAGSRVEVVGAEGTTLAVRKIADGIKEDYIGEEKT